MSVIPATVDLFGSVSFSLTDANHYLSTNHYLGPINRGVVYADDFGLMVLANPSSRRLPPSRWVELVRWCLVGAENGGSQQWRQARQWLLTQFPTATTVVSYSDPAQGHTGALYRACNWLWAPTWHRLRPPPSGNGNWGSGNPDEAVKDRWIFPLRKDAERASILAVKDDALRRQWPWAEYQERRGGDYKRFVSELKRTA